MNNIQVVVVNSHGVGQYVHIPRLPVQGETIRGWGWRVEQDGGKGSNTAIALGRLGIRAAYVGKVGEDLWGDLGKLWMSEAGVDVSSMYRSSHVSTGTGLIMLDEDGKSTIINGGSSGRALTEEEIIQGVQKFPDAKILMTGFEIPEHLALLAAKTGKQRGMYTVVNPSPLPENPMESLDFVDLLLVNEVEAVGLLGEARSVISHKDLLDDLQRKLKCRQIIMTLGESGAAGLDENHFWTCQGIPVEAVDTTGAGDGFGAALVAALLGGRTLEEASCWANLYAAYTVQRMGTIPSYPTRDQIEEYARQFGYDCSFLHVKDTETEMIQ